jgi:hypothetical protein
MRQGTNLTMMTLSGAPSGGAGGAKSREIAFVTSNAGRLKLTGVFFDPRPGG